MQEHRYIPGDQWGICDICGFKYRRSSLRMNWKRQLVCKADFEPRHPHERLRAKKDKIYVANARPRPVDRHASFGVDRDGIATAQTPAGASNLTLNGVFATSGKATLDVDRRITIYSDGDESGLTFTATGTDEAGDAVSEEITGPNATTVTGDDEFFVITQIAVDGAGTGNIEVGTAEESGYTIVAAVTADSL